MFDKTKLKNWTALNDIHALQVLSELCQSNKGPYNSYELNLVLKTGKRISVIDHSHLHKICEEADRLSTFLGKPVWDAIEQRG